MGGLNNETAGNCNQYYEFQNTFVEAVIYDSTLLQLSAYHPLVIDSIPFVPRTNPQLVAPASVVIPTGAVVGIWFGTNANTLTLLDNGEGSLAEGIN